MNALPLVLITLASQSPASAGTGQERFAVDLLRALAEKPGNTLVSPYSIAEAFALAREGARGPTASEIDEALRFSASGALEELRKLREALEPKPTRRGEAAPYELRIANSAWVQQGYGLERDFVERTSLLGGARFFDADFRGQAGEVRERINAWVASGTKDKIRELLPAGTPTPDTRVLLANAVYLHASWSTPFSASRTRPSEFHAASGSVQVATMHATETLRYGESAAARVAALPYLGGLEMLLVLPKEVDGIAAVLATESLAEWTAKLESRPIQLALPKFELAYGNDLVPGLTRLGIECAFDPQRADFTALSPRAKDPSAPLFIGIVRHRTWISVDEKGTEAAAATSLDFKVGSAVRPDPPTPFVVDHPFLFFVRHRATGAVLFAGRIDDPTK